MQFLYFFIYKLYRFGLTQSNPKLAFILYLTVFEIIHLLLLGIILKIIGIGIHINSQYFPGLVLISILAAVNYLLFSNEMFIKKMETFYSNKKYNVLKTNLTFFIYLLFLIFLLFFMTSIYRRTR